jgi:cytochrome c biogenesis protein CcmG, thiol:disulfide interchange protein DsbE
MRFACVWAGVPSSGPTPSLPPVPKPSRVIPAAIAMSLLIAACAPTVVGPLPDAPTPVALAELEELVGSASPAVVNVWASWCVPCRSEAPLVSEASRLHRDVTFIGLNVRDAPEDARRFMAAYLDDAEMTHLSDRSGSIPIALGATNGVPLTFFYGADGVLVYTHFGAIDEPTMARYLDEITR